MKTDKLARENQEVLSRIDAKVSAIQTQNPVPYLNSQVLVSGMRNALEKIITSPNEGYSGAQQQVAIATYAEVLEAILDTVMSTTGPTTCVYIRAEELRRMISESKLETDAEEQR